MSRNPNYTGLQTFNIPVNMNALLFGKAPFPVRGVSERQNMANRRDVVVPMIRPRNENAVESVLPSIVVERQPTIDLGTATPRTQAKPLYQ